MDHSLPVWSPEEPLIHIGTLDPAHKGCRGDSLEGHGLSVSECPQAWEAIAKLGGQPWWELAKTGGAPKFLDWHAVPEPLQCEILAWAQAQGFVEPRIVYKLSWLDCETSSRVFMSFDDRQAAQAEFDWQTGDLDEERAPRLEEMQGHRLTPEGLRALARKHASPHQAPELAAVLYCEVETDLDGVFWRDELDVAGLSAPRAVVFPGRLGSFQISPADWVEQEAEREW